MGKENAQRVEKLEKSGGYISIDPQVAIDRNIAVITEIRKLVVLSQKQKPQQATKQEKK